MKNILTKAKKFMLFVGIVCIISSITVLVRANMTDPYSWAQCGADSYVECSGGTRCTSTDNVGCKCYDRRGFVVMSHSCSEAAP